ncbi:MAG TPA: LptE family protein [Tepidisphaeraceae bacterium]|jgi:hypothetical protein
MIIPPRLIGSVLLPSCLLLLGCGYQQSGSVDSSGQSNYKWSSLYREDVSTVAVPIFANKDFRRGMEFGLTSAVIKQMEAHSPYRVAPRGRADTILEGEIVSVELSTLSRDVRTNVPQEQLYIMTVNFRWTDLRSGRILLERRNFQQTAPFYGTLGEGEFVGSQNTIERLALAIVQEMQVDW